jgi:hypothetical protein
VVVLKLPKQIQEKSQPLTEKVPTGGKARGRISRKAPLVGSEEFFSLSSFLVKMSKEIN